MTGWNMCMVSHEATQNSNNSSCKITFSRIAAPYTARLRYLANSPCRVLCKCDKEDFSRLEVKGKTWKLTSVY